MGEDGLSGAYGRKRSRARPGKPNGAELPNALDRSFDGCAPRTHARSDLAYVRAGGSWRHVRLLVDPCNGEVVGRSAGSGKGAKLAKAAFATPGLPISDIEVFHTDRGGESGNAEIGLMLEAFGIGRSLSAKGCPHGNAVDGSTGRRTRYSRRSWSTGTASPTSATCRPSCPTTCTGTTTSGSTRRSAT